MKLYLAHSSTIIFLCGFIFDAFVLPDIEDQFARIIGLVYLALIAFCIFIREWIISKNRATPFEQKLFSVITFAISYFSGSALSFVFIYTIRSAALSVSWPLFLILFLCILANEFVSTHSYRFMLDVGILFIAILFYTIFTTPFILNVQNDVTFLISLGISVLVASTYIYILQLASETAEYEAPRGYALAVGIPLFVGMLYFLNIIPAVPLSLEKSGIYHQVTRTSTGDFEGDQEHDTPHGLLTRFRTPVYHLTPQDTGVYFYSAINAPAELTAPVSHVWEQYDELTKKWSITTTIPFDVSGGRNAGYRAYSYKENISEGLWRVTVKVDDNRIVGRVTFIVKKTDSITLERIKL